MSLKAQDGSSTSMATHSNRMTIFDVGSQRPYHWPVLCVGLPRLAGSWWELRLMTAALLNGCGSKLRLNYPLYHYSTILVPLVSLPTGLCRDEKRARRLEHVWILYFYVWVCAWMHAGVARASVHHWARLSGHCWRHRLSRRTLIGSAGDDELEVDEVEMN